MDTLVQDFRFGLRTLWKRKGFTLVVILTLGLALGTTTTLFSIVSTVLFTPLPVEKPNEMVFVWSRNDELSRVRAPLSLPDFVDLRLEQTAFEDLAAMSSTVYTLTGLAEPVYLQGYRVSASFFALTGVPIARGRPFDPDAERVALLSHGAWERRFGADPEILGREITLDGVSHTVIGVVSADVEVGPFERAEVWAPLQLDPVGASREARNISVMGRLRPEVSFEEAAAEIQTLSERLEESYPGTNAGWTLFTQPLAEAMAGASVRAVFLLLFLTVAFVMSIACANVAHMLMSRSEDRRREFAVRAALGASRVRIVRQLLTEGTVISMGAATLGLVLMQWTMYGMVWLTREQVPLFTRITIHENALMFTAGLVILTPLFFALAPALRTASLRPSNRRPHSFLVAGEVAMALVLLVVAGLMVRSVQALRDIDLGFDPANVLTMRVDLPASRYDDEARVRAFFDRLEAETRAMPGVRGVALSSHRPIVGSEPNQSLVIERRPAADERDLPWAAIVTVSPEFFSTMRVPVLEGRIFTQTDASPVALVSEAARARYWAGDSPVGDRILLDETWTTIVGVVGDLRNPDADQPPEPHVYLPTSQSPTPAMAMLVRADQPLALAPSIRRKVAELDPMQPVHDVRTMSQILYDDLSGPFSIAGLMGYFTLIALGLATAGIFGVLSHSVTARSRELGVRMANGARATDIAWMILRQGLAPIAAGLILGSVAALGLSRLMASMLYGISPTDPVTYAGVSLLLTAVALVASVVPAIRAARSDPLITLRHE